MLASELFLRPIAVNTMKLYAALSGLGRLNYRAKIMSVAFLGTHVPLLAIVGFFLFRTTSDMTVIWSTLAVALVATLVGTGLTLFVLNHLLQPVLLTSKALRAYRDGRTVPDLPTGFTDEAGTLMADAQLTLTHLEASLRLLETTDATTGLPNRTEFLHQLDQSLVAGSGEVVAVFDMPNVPLVAATFDQPKADAYVRAMASRLSEGLGRSVQLARVDAGMLAALVPAAGGNFDAASLAARINDVLAGATADVSIDEINISPELVAGIAQPGQDGETADVLLANAVAAAALNKMPRSVNFHSPAARDAARERFELEQELRHAIKAEQFELHFQPVVDLERGRTTGAEALIRWRHPERGLIAPGAFIPTAEQSDLINDIGRFVIREACSQVGRWQSELMAPLKVAVNLSARQFHDPHLLGLLAESISDAHIDPSQLEIELTESAAMVDYDHTRRLFGRLNDMGLSIAIDDFGTGYASMSYLRKLPFDKLKIDREFVSNIDTSRQNQAISNAVIALGKGLGLRVLAEGAERKEEIAYLRDAGCSLFQGYYFAKPVEAAQMGETLADIDLKIAAGQAENEKASPLARSA